MNQDKFSRFGYQIIEELGHNLTGGRVTYKAIHLPSKEAVVLKEFQFLGTWQQTEYDAYEQEIEVLRGLSHPGIPRYLDTFETEDGFCMVQQYINAQSLAFSRQWELADIKHIALAVLRILVYLQEQKPPLIHRDIKPENILIDEEKKVYLVDFGFARIGGGAVALSSIVKGTMGFMPPEQLFNRKLTLASDLYGLGATLICLLTGVKSVDIGSLIDSDYRIHFRHLVPPLQRGWINWLEKMVEPFMGDRYPSARQALEALKPIDVYQLPKVRLDQGYLTLKGEKWGEVLTEKIRIVNPIPNTILSGRWEVAPHPSDPPHTPYDHSWIEVYPSKFEGNEVECEIRVKTAQLIGGETYDRQLVLQTNSSPDSYQISIEVNTALPPKKQGNFYSYLIFLLLLFAFGGFLISSPILHFFFLFALPGMVVADKILMTAQQRSDIDTYYVVISSLLLGMLTFPLGLILSLLLPVPHSIHTGTWLFITIVTSGFLGGACLGISYRKNKGSVWYLIGKIVFSLLFLFCVLPAFLFSLILQKIYNVSARELEHKSGFNLPEAKMIPLLTSSLGIYLGVWGRNVFNVWQSILSSKLEFDFLFIILASLVPLMFLCYLWFKEVIIVPLKNNNKWQHYQKSKEQLIKP